jgi:signal peptidase
MLKKICNILITILILAMAVFAGLFLVPRLLGYQSYAVISGSMEPGIPVGSVVFSKPIDPNTLSIGDVITFSIDQDTVVTHRIVDVDSARREVTTQGDANNAPDGNPVSFDRIKGKEAFSVPLLGYVSIYIRTPLGIAWICGILILIILLGFLPDLLSKNPKDSEDEEEKEQSV